MRREGESWRNEERREKRRKRIREMREGGK